MFVKLMKDTHTQKKNVKKNMENVLKPLPITEIYWMTSFGLF